MRRLALLGLFVTSSAAAQRGDTIVRQATRPVHAGVADLSRELVIGVADGDEHYMIGAIDDITVGPTGTIYVLDRTVPAIRTYDAKGQFVRNIGRRGSGPGEFRWPAAIAIASSGRLLVWDTPNARINVYTPGGDVIGSWPTQGTSGATASGRRLLVSDSTGTTWLDTRFIPRTGAGAIQLVRAWIRFDSAGDLRDTILQPPSPRAAEVTAAKRGASMSIGVPFAPEWKTAVSPRGYLVTGFTSRLAFESHAASGVISVRRDVATVAVTDRERDSARAEVSKRMQSFDPSWSWNGPEIPRTKSAYLDLVVGDDGRVWVRRQEGPRFDEPAAPGARGGGGGTRMGAGRGTGRGQASSWNCPTNGWALHDVFDPGGRYVGQVRVPEKVDVIAQRGDYVWAATCNADDVPQVVRYRIAWR